MRSIGNANYRLITKKASFMFLSLILVMLIVTQAGYAATYPAKAITIIVPWGAGGGTDTLARLLAGPLSKELGVDIIIVNKAGAGGAVGLQEVANMRPDGYTLTISTGSLIIQKYSLAQGLIDYKRYTPIACLAVSTPVLVVHKDSPWRTIDDLVRDAKARPGKVLLSNSGTGSATHLWSVKFAADKGIEVQHVPYDGGKPQATAVMGKQVDATIIDTTGVHSLMSSGDLRIIAGGVDTPEPLYPNAPPFSKYGVKLWDLWYGMWAPKGVPREIVQHIYRALNKAVLNTEYQEGLKRMALIPKLSTPEEFGRIWESDDKVIKAVFDSIKK